MTTPIRPYLTRAIYEWIVDNNLTPYITVNALMPGVQVPERFVENGHITLNIAPQAVNKLMITNEAIEFDARFSGVIWHIYVPIAGVQAVFARENGRGMAFTEQDLIEETDENKPSSLEAKAPSAKPAKPHLKIIK